MRPEKRRGEDGGWGEYFDNFPDFRGDEGDERVFQEGLDC